jgi:hypothetical protein
MTLAKILLSNLLMQMVINMCCSGGGSIRKIQIDRSVTKQPVAQSRIERKPSKDGEIQIQRHALIANIRCPRCNSHIMLVNINNRERKQCTSCKYIIN